jgi:hypothetical protein
MSKTGLWLIEAAQRVIPASVVIDFLVLDQEAEQQEGIYGHSLMSFPA